MNKEKQQEVINHYYPVNKNEIIKRPHNFSMQKYIVNKEIIRRERTSDEIFKGRFLKVYFLMPIKLFRSIEQLIKNSCELGFVESYNERGIDTLGNVSFSIDMNSNFDVNSI